MAYLDIQFSKQEMGIVVDNIPIETEQPASNVNDATDSTENSNFQIARKLKDEKFRLINALSQFPVTALWLLNEYEQKAYT
ncbi:MAG: RNA polymerase subunit sigma, partial [Methylococcaceae bacterium]|nr:RNA polymerase subunit sigma [Methylococcaceae bacterium]